MIIYIFENQRNLNNQLNHNLSRLGGSSDNVYLRQKQRFVGNSSGNSCPAWSCETCVGI